MIAPFCARQNSLACQLGVQECNCTVSLDSSLTKSSSSKCSLISPALFLQEFHIDLLDTWGKDVHGCALLQHNLQQQNAENKINEHHHMLVKLWAINTAELWSHVKERWHPYVLRYLGECFRLLSENKQTNQKYRAESTVWAYLH